MGGDHGRDALASIASRQGDAYKHAFHPAAVRRLPFNPQQARRNASG